MDKPNGGKERQPGEKVKRTIDNDEFMMRLYQNMPNTDTFHAFRISTYQQMDSETLTLEKNSKSTGNF